MHLQNNPQLRSLVKKLLGLPLTIVTFYFIGVFIWKSFPKIESHLTSINVPLLILGTLFITVFFALKAYTWIKILDLFDQHISYLTGSYLLTISELKRYIPGNIFGFISRTHNFQKEKIKSSVVISSIVLESALLIIGSLVVSIPSFIFYFQLLIHRVDVLVVILSVIGGVLLFSAGVYLFRKKIQAIVATLLKRKNIPLLINIIVLNILSWTFFGLGNYLVATSFSYLNPYHIVIFSSLFVLSWVIGYLSFIAPMGLGVREVIITLALSSFIPVYFASSIAILLRIMFIVAELVFLVVSSLLNRYSKQVVRIAKKTSPHVSILWISIASYIAYFTYVTIAKHNNFFTGRFDLGNMDQTVWNTLHGNIFMLTDPNGTAIVSRIAFHADFLLVLLAPFYLIWSDPRMLLILQTIILGLGAYFVYQLALLVIKNKNISLALSISYLLNPFIQRQNLYDFHAVIFVGTFFIAAFYFMQKKKWFWTVIFLFLAVLTKENIYLITTLIGFYILLAKKKLKLGSVIILLSISMFFFIMKKLIPSASGNVHFALSYLSDFGNSTPSIMKNIIIHPIRTLSVMIHHGGINYVFQLLLPLGFVSLAAPLFLIFAVPDLTKNLLSSNANLQSFYFQYTAELVPFIYISAIFGIRTLLSHKNRFISASIIFYGILLFAFFGQWLNGPLPGARYASLEVFTNPTEHAKEINTYLRSIPENERVASSNNLGAHLSERHYIYTLPQGMQQADYILFLLTDTTSEPSLAEQKAMVKSLEKNQHYSLDYQIGKFYSFKKHF